jgi:hypothetical protein
MPVCHPTCTHCLSNDVYALRKQQCARRRHQCSSSVQRCWHQLPGGMGLMFLCGGCWWELERVCLVWFRVSSLFHVPVIDHEACASALACFSLCIRPCAASALCQPESDADLHVPSVLQLPARLSVLQIASRSTQHTNWTGSCRASHSAAQQSTSHQEPVT